MYYSVLYSREKVVLRPTKYRWTFWLGNLKGQYSVLRSTPYSKASPGGFRKHAHLIMAKGYQAWGMTGY